MLTISEAQRRTELFLTGQMLEALRAVEYGLPALIPSCTDVDLAEIARARVEIRHVRGASDATYLINAFGEYQTVDAAFTAVRDPRASMVKGLTINCMPSSSWTPLSAAFSA